MEKIKAVSNFTVNEARPHLVSAGDARPAGFHLCRDCSNHSRPGCLSSKGIPLEYTGIVICDRVALMIYLQDGHIVAGELSASILP